jgi:hypothetical protein
MHKGIFGKFTGRGRRP